MRCLGWILVLCAAISVTLAGFCTEKYSCGRECTGRWFKRRCRPKLCYRKVCCPGFHGVSCNLDDKECLENHDGCSHGCVNTYGSYKCTCPAGYVLSSDRRNCRSNWCTESRSCYKICTGHACTRRWLKTRCRYYSFRCLGKCYQRVCCQGWTGHNCHIPSG